MRKSLRKSAVLYWKKGPFKLFQIYKRIYQPVRINRSNQKRILFIIGCQRSGTTLITRIFEKDFNTKVYGEFSELSSNDINKIRLNPLSSVKEIIDKNKIPFVIVKPLVETQNLLKLFEYFKGAKALWMCRHYKDVSLSNLEYFGITNGINDLRPIVENQTQNWRAENVSVYTRKIILNYFSEDMNPYDAAALFWFARNRLFFELNLNKHPNVIMCKYEDLVKAPSKIMKKVYKFNGCIYPGNKIIAEIHSKSKGRGRNIKLSPKIGLLCNELWEKLNRVYQSKDYYTLPSIKTEGT